MACLHDSSFLLMRKCHLKLHLPLMFWIWLMREICRVVPIGRHAVLHFWVMPDWNDSAGTLWPFRKWAYRSHFCWVTPDKVLTRPSCKHICYKCERTPCAVAEWQLSTKACSCSSAEWWLIVSTAHERHMGTSLIFVARVSEKSRQHILNANACALVNLLPLETNNNKFISGDCISWERVM